MKLNEVLNMNSEDIVDLAYETWLNSDHRGTVNYMDLVPEGPEDDCHEVTERGLKDWFHSWVEGLSDPDELYADGFTPYEERRLNHLADDFTYAAIDGMELSYEMELTYASLPR